MQTAVNYQVWTMNQGPLSLEAQAEIDQAIEKAIKQVEKKEGTRLLYQKVYE
ncbi:MAG: hypothetical protein KGL39_46535 [Patescibacteria group bacterium]|nr:hypothetical protein [Patescibacteria group bacterium]